MNIHEVNRLVLPVLKLLGDMDPWPLLSIAEAAVEAYRPNYLYDHDSAAIKDILPPDILPIAALVIDHMIINGLLRIGTFESLDINDDSSYLDKDTLRTHHQYMTAMYNGQYPYPFNEPFLVVYTLSVSGKQALDALDSTDP